MASQATLKTVGQDWKQVFAKIKCILIDLSGTLHIGDTPIEDAVSALQRLRNAGYKIRFVTNTTKESQRSLHQRLTNMGFEMHLEEMITSLVATRKYVEKRNLKPFLILDKKAAEEFEGVNCDDPNAVVIGLGKAELNYSNLNIAFRLLNSGAEFIAVHKGKYYRDESDLSLGPGPFVTALEYATDKEAIVIGKPSPNFFVCAIESTGCELSEAVMIGDDVRDDIAGAISFGMKGILVKTGKYRERDEDSISPQPDFVVETFASAVHHILHEQ